MAAACMIRSRLQALKLAAGFFVYSDSKRFCCLFCHMRQYFRLIRCCTNAQKGLLAMLYMHFPNYYAIACQSH